eukprot:9509657-Karenia_brevis.AAC.1
MEAGDVVVKREANTGILKSYETLSERLHAASCELQAVSGDRGMRRSLRFAILPLADPRNSIFATFDTGCNACCRGVDW